VGFPLNFFVFRQRSFISVLKYFSVSISVSVLHLFLSCSFVSVSVSVLSALFIQESLRYRNFKFDFRNLPLVTCLLALLD